ncbi:hypothetical protein AVEN_63750-1 [Araneus ventricosus]|uniref:Uncharacterized protein n=1 Tax=Araneus ventricosus TaxID=182803 RepID=A0A4Y2RXH3_ARAVE|nr:hypothetical protein AVEN_63750-1 [Araneus ventricosus]
MARLSCKEEESLSNTSHSEESTETLEEKSLTWYKKLEKAIHSKTKVLYCSTSKSSSLSKIVKEELQLFDSIENRSSNIIELEALKTIPPTEAEAHFLLLVVHNKAKN